jgi:guanyl-specific ribonuclease Sa
MRAFRVRLFLGIAACAILGFGCTHSNQDASGTQLSASEQQKQAQMTRKAGVDVMSAQINGSNLPPEQKQRLLEQVRTNGGK